MKQLRILLPLVIAILTLGCTHNDGDIGPWFGAWAMPSMTVDGKTPADFSPTNTIWEFQSEIVCIRLLGEHHNIDSWSWGTWHEADGHIYIDYTHSNSAGPSEYDSPAWLLIANREVADLTIVERGDRRMVLEYTTPDGKKVIYTLKKTW